MDAPSQTVRKAAKALRVRRGRVGFVNIYEIKEDELDQLERGTECDVKFNFAVFLISTATASIIALATANIESEVVRMAFLLIAVIGVVAGSYLFISWHRSRIPLSALCQRIRERIPPD